MSHTRVKTTYSIEGAYGSTDTVELYCHHNHSADYTAFYDKEGSPVQMIFNEWKSGDDLYDAMERLMWPFNGNVWGEGGLKDKVEFYGVAPWEVNGKVTERLKWLEENHFVISDGIVDDLGKKGDYVIRIGKEVIIVTHDLLTGFGSMKWTYMQQRFEKLVKQYKNR